MVLGADVNLEMAMKKTKRLLSAFFLSATFTVAACGQSKETVASPAPEKTPEIAAAQTKTGERKANIEGKEFVLRNNAGVCELVFGDKTYDLGIPWQCDFHRSPEKTVRVFPRDFYSDRKKFPKNFRSTQIILIEHSTADPNNPIDCRIKLRAVKIAGGKIFVSKATSNLASCPKSQWEDKNFTGFFE